MEMGIPLRREISKPKSEVLFAIPSHWGDSSSVARKLCKKGEKGSDVVTELAECLGYSEKLAASDIFLGKFNIYLWVFYLPLLNNSWIVHTEFVWSSAAVDGL